MSTLAIHAGPDALAELRTRGLEASRVRVLVGASGGPKWLVLHGLDRVLFPWLLAGTSEQAPVHAVASSIGSWRFAALAQPEPVAALDRFAHAYVEQRYRKSPTPREVSDEGERIFDRLLDGTDSAVLATHAKLRLHIVTTRFKHFGTHEGLGQTLALGLAALGNAAHRRTLAAFVERVVFDARGELGPFAPWRSLPTRHVTLDAANVRAALMASAAIPAVMAGVVDPPGAPRGVYRDGGIADYHFGAEIDPPAALDGIALYPHFYSQLVPGWFDKGLSWRKTRGLRRVVLVAPSAEYVASLPGGRIPDRVDFARMSDEARMSAWNRTLELGKQLGESFGELVRSGKIADLAQPLG